MNPLKPRTDDIAVAATQLFRRADRVCVAFSGGVDSTVLLHALVYWANVEKKRNVASEPIVTAIHVSHGLSPNADTWAQHCETVCSALGIALKVARVQVDLSSGIGIEAAARHARYAAIRAHAAELRGALGERFVVATAHHARDQAETVLLQLLRGAGPAGLSAMAEHGAEFTRPFLHVSKQSIDAYAAHHSLAFIEDESNASTRFARNRLRLNVWPSLTHAFPSAEKTLARAASLQADAASLLNELAEIDLEACADGGKLQRTVFRTLSPARRANLVRTWLAAHGEPAQDAARMREWIEQLSIESDDQHIVIAHHSMRGTLRCFRDHIHYVFPSEIRVDRRIQTGTLKLDLHALPLALSHGTISLQRARETAESALDKVPNNSPALRGLLLGDTLAMRVRREADAIRLSPNSGGVSLKNLFQHHNVPTWHREGWPVVVTGERVVALLGVATDYEVAVQVPWVNALRWQPRCEPLAPSEEN